MEKQEQSPLKGVDRFFIHKSIEAFAAAIVQRHGSPSEQAFLFPCHSAAVRCVQFFHTQAIFPQEDAPSIVDLYPNDETRPTISAVLLSRKYTKIVKTFWQHTGEGISSRQAEYCHKAFDDGRLSAKGTWKKRRIGDVKLSEASYKGPKRYRKPQIKGGPSMVRNGETLKTSLGESQDSARFVEERFGRNLDPSLSSNAKLAIRKRIAGALTADIDLPEALEASHIPTRTAYVDGFSEEDVYLFPCGMNSIYNSHRLLMACRGKYKSISYG